MLSHGGGRLKAVIANKRPTLATLAATLDLDLDSPSIEQERLPEAKQDLIAVLALPDAEREAALGEWLGKHLVDQGNRLLIPERRRIDVLTRNRDVARRVREAKPAGRMVSIKVTTELAEQLRDFVATQRLADEGAAITMLLAKALPKPRNAGKSAFGRTADLFGSLEARDDDRGNAPES